MCVCVCVCVCVCIYTCIWKEEGRKRKRKREKNSVRERVGNCNIFVEEILFLDLLKVFAQPLGPPLVNYILASPTTSLPNELAVFFR